MNSSINYRDSGHNWIGKIPKSWSCVALRHLAEVMPSNIDKKSEEGQTTIRLCNYLDVYKNKYISSELPFMSATATEAQIIKFKLQKGDVIATKDSEDPADIAIPALVVQDFSDVVCGYHLTLMRSNGDQLRGEFLFWLLSSTNYRHYFSIAANGVTRFGIGTSAFKNVPIVLPDLKTQIQIATYLDRKTTEIDKLISKKQKLIELLEEERTALINQAVTRGIDPRAKMKPSDIEWLGDVPAHWEVWKISHAFKTIGSGTTPESGNNQYHENGTVNWINTGDLNDDKLFTCSKKVTEQALSDYSALKIYPSGSVVIAMYGATIGKVSFVQFEATVNQACCVFNHSAVITQEFLFFWFRAMKQHIINLAKGGGQPNISQDILRNIRIPCPTPNEQGSIVQYIKQEDSRLTKIIDKVLQEISLLNEYKTALISEVVTGKVDVRGEVDGKNERELRMVAEETGKYVK